MPKTDDYKSSYPVSSIVAPGTLTCCQLKDVLHSKREGLLQHTLDYEEYSWEYALARLVFYENSLIGQQMCPFSALTGVRILKRVEFWKNVRAFPRDKENCP